MTTCPALGLDYGTLGIGLVVGAALALAAVFVSRRALDQDDAPEHDPYARPFADSEGGR